MVEPLEHTQLNAVAHHDTVGHAIQCSFRVDGTVCGWVGGVVWWTGIGNTRRLVFVAGIHNVHVAIEVLVHQKHAACRGRVLCDASAGAVRVGRELLFVELEVGGCGAGLAGAKVDNGAVDGVRGVFKAQREVVQSIAVDVVRVDGGDGARVAKVELGIATLEIQRRGSASAVKHHVVPHRVPIGVAVSLDQKDLAIRLNKCNVGRAWVVEVGVLYGTRIVGEPQVLRRRVRRISEKVAHGEALRVPNLGKRPCASGSLCTGHRGNVDVVVAPEHDE